MSDDLNPETRRLVDLARQARTPGESDKLRIAERLAVPLAAGIATGSAAATAKAGGLGLGAKLAALVAVGAVGAAVVVSRAPSPASAPASAPVITQPAPSPPRVVAPEPTAAEPAPVQAPEPAPTPKTVMPSKSGDALAEEAALLHQAQAAWRAGQSAQALTLANQHAQRFPRSQLANERDVLRVLSMCKLGQVQSAKQVGARLLKKAKGSPWYQSVAESCASD